MMSEDELVNIGKEISELSDIAAKLAQDSPRPLRPYGNLGNFDYFARAKQLYQRYATLCAKCTKINCSPNTLQALVAHMTFLQEALYGMNAVYGIGIEEQRTSFLIHGPPRAESEKTK